eukprot:gene4975-22093_t
MRATKQHLSSAGHRKACKDPRVPRARGGTDRWPGSMRIDAGTINPPATVP